jgi:hypothetical protein
MVCSAWRAVTTVASPPLRGMHDGKVMPFASKVAHLLALERCHGRPNHLWVIAARRNLAHSARFSIRNCATSWRAVFSSAFEPGRNDI